VREQTYRILLVDRIPLSRNSALGIWAWNSIRSSYHPCRKRVTRASSSTDLSRGTTFRGRTLRYSVAKLCASAKLLHSAKKNEEIYRGKILSLYDKLFISSDYIQLLKWHYVSVIINDCMNIVKESNSFILWKMKVRKRKYPYNYLIWYRCNFIDTVYSNVIIITYLRLHMYE